MQATTKIVKTDDEYRIRLYIDGQYQAGADCFESDRQAARETAAAMVLSAGYSDKCTDYAADELAAYMEDME